MSDASTLCTAFAGSRRIASGALELVVQRAKKVLDRDARAQVLIFDDQTSEAIEVDFRGTVADVRRRLPALPPQREAPRQAGRPKLGVVAHEVTLLPRHWDWLTSQPGGASVALRKLVEAARRQNEPKDQVRQAQEATYRFMSAMAGNEPGFEEAARALFGGGRDRFERETEAWPADVRDHTRKLAAGVFQS